jgi:hypothetical protein
MSQHFAAFRLPGQYLNEAFIRSLGDRLSEVKCVATHFR